MKEIVDNQLKIIQKINQMDTEKQKKTIKPLVVTGCSGVGKGTLLKELFKAYPDMFELSVSYTTRKPRPGEQHGRQYFFVNHSDFQQHPQNFVEQCHVHDNYYGTSKIQVNEIISRGHIPVLQIDIQGGMKAHKAYNGQCNFLFIDCPSLQILEQRLRERATESQQQIQKRMKNARIELEQASTVDYYHHIVNDKKQTALKQLFNYVNEKYQLKSV